MSGSARAKRLRRKGDPGINDRLDLAMAAHGDGRRDAALAHANDAFRRASPRLWGRKVDICCLLRCLEQEEDDWKIERWYRRSLRGRA